MDGLSYKPNPVNRWTSYGSTNTSDWLEVDFGEAREVSRAEIYIFDDCGGVQAPASYTVQYFANGEWHDAFDQVKSPSTPIGGAINTVAFQQGQHLEGSRCLHAQWQSAQRRDGTGAVEEVARARRALARRDAVEAYGWRTR